VAELSSAPLAAPNVTRATENALHALRLQEFPFAHGKGDLIPYEIRSLAAERKDLPGALLHRQTVSPARHRFASPVLAKRCIHMIAELTPTSNCSAVHGGNLPLQQSPAFPIHRDMVYASAMLCESMRQTGLTPASSESPFIRAGDILLAARRSPRKASYSRAVYLQSGSPTAGDMKEHLLKATTLIAPHQLAGHADVGKPAVAHNGHVVA
jgi:hypothetical protein